MAVRNSRAQEDKQGCKTLVQDPKNKLNCKGLAPLHTGRAQAGAWGAGRSIPSVDSGFLKGFSGAKNHDDLKLINREPVDLGQALPD